MANSVNRSPNGPPVQGRRRECLRRLRQQQKKRTQETERRIVEALHSLPLSVVERLAELDDAQTAYLEEEIARADIAADLLTPEQFAEYVLRAAQRS